MNLKLMRAEVRVLRRASLRVMHNSLSLIGFVVVVAGVWTAFHPQVLKDAAIQLVPGAAASAPAPHVDPFAGAIGDASGEASRLLGLAAGDAVDEPVLVRANADAGTP